MAGPGRAQKQHLSYRVQTPSSGDSTQWQLKTCRPQAVKPVNCAQPKFSQVTMCNKQTKKNIKASWRNYRSSALKSKTSGEGRWYFTVNCLHFVEAFLVFWSRESRITSLALWRNKIISISISEWSRETGQLVMWLVDEPSAWSTHF